jgi:hypothetical protein
MPCARRDGGAPGRVSSDTRHVSCWRLTMGTHSEGQARTLHGSAWGPRARAWIGPLALASVSAACRSAEQVPDRADAGSPTTAPSAGADAIARAENAAKLLGKRLRERLSDAQNLGPERAIQVCADEAQSITAAVRAETGLAVGRSSSRLRSERDAAPPWVAAWIAAQGERNVEGVAAIRVVEQAPSGQVARVILPIGVEAMCLRCHGDRDQLSPGVRAVLDTRYPTDRATGYATGDLRGALWAEAPVR